MVSIKTIVGQMRSGLFMVILPICLSLGSTPIKVFLLAGQSNMSGWTSTDRMPTDLVPPQTQVLIHADGEISASKARKWLNCGINFGKSNGFFGPELAFGKTLGDSCPGGMFALIKYAVGGTELATRWRPPGSGGTVGDLYMKFMNEIDTALATLDTQYQPEITGMLWMQGEFDALRSAYANEYGYNLANLIKDIREKVDDDDLPFIIGMIDAQPSWTYHRIVREAEIAVAADIPNVGIFDTRGYPTDGIHYLLDGMILLGRTFALTVLSGGYIRVPAVTPFSETGGRGVLSAGGSEDATGFYRFDLLGRRVERSLLRPGMIISDRREMIINPSSRRASPFVRHPSLSPEPFNAAPR